VARASGRVPLYRERLREAGLRAAALRSLADVRRLPFTVKDDFRAAYPFGLFAIPREQCLRIHASSGTTGKPTVVGYSRRDIETWADIIARSMRAAGCRPGMLAQNSYGYGLFTGGLGFHHGAERLGLTVVPVSGGMTERQVKLIGDLKPDIIFVTPSYLLAILDEFQAQGVDPRQSSIKIAMCGAEPWTNAMRAEIEDAFDMHAIDNYGLSEVIGPGVSCECIEDKNGMHIWEDHFYPEVVDPETGAPVADGEPGELVFTSLTKEAMPVVRYRTRDLTRLLPGTARTMRRIEKITGRSDDMMIIRGVNVFPTQIEELILQDAMLAPHYQVEITRPRNLDEMTVLVERAPSAGGSDGDAAGARLAGRVKNLVGVSCAVRVLAPGGVERSLGKAKRVVDKRALR
jgi:phenylacetate-CoA ligase